MKRNRSFIHPLRLASLVALMLAPPGFTDLGAPHAAATERTIDVSTASALAAALRNAQPGDTIRLADGTYKGRFVVAASGTADSRVTLQGSRDAVLDGSSPTRDYGLHLKASYWTLRGFTVTNSQKGIMLDGAHYNALDELEIHHVGHEAVHFRKHSSNNVIRNSVIYATGLTNPGFGEGVYIGSASADWATLTGGQPDRSDYNQVLNNSFGPNVSAEHVDAKEGTTSGVIAGNSFDGRGMSGASAADSWVDIKGNGYTIGNNTGTAALLDGFQTHVVSSGWGNDNVFHTNRADVQSSGYGFRIQVSGSNGTATGNHIHSDNIVTNAGSGISNIPLTP